MAADVLSKLGSKRALVPAGVFMQALNSPTVKIEEEPPTKPDLAPSLGQEVLVAGREWFRKITKRMHYFLGRHQNSQEKALFHWQFNKTAKEMPSYLSS